MNTNPKRLPEPINFLSVEGVIGVGKTSFCQLLAKKFNLRTLLEPIEENPFLVAFYKDRQSVAFQTQMWFLLTRYKQISESFAQQDLFHSATVTDYIYAKDAIFANINLDNNELALYNSVASVLERRIPKPDFVIYLQASTDVLLKRIEKRGRSFEFNIERRYIETLNEAYNYFFIHYNHSPLLIVNTDDMDFITVEKDFEEIVEQIFNTKWGRNYYSPLGNKGRLIMDEKKDKTK
jgi:deoxyadenosine/deoxycytidine kinase